MVCIAHPRERTHNTDGNGEVGHDAHNEYGIMIVLVVDEYESHSKDEPSEARRCAA